MAGVYVPQVTIRLQLICATWLAGNLRCITLGMSDAIAMADEEEDVGSLMDRLCLVSWGFIIIIHYRMRYFIEIYP